MNMADERRTCHRQDSLFGATLIGETKQGGLLLLDVSQKGCRGTTRLALEVGEQVTVRIPVEDEPSIIALGRTQWSRPVPNTESLAIGIEFHSFPQARDSDRLIAQLKKLGEERTRRRVVSSDFERLRNLDQETGRQMSALVKLNRQLNSSHKIEEVMETLLDIVTSVIRSERALVMFDHGGPVPEVVASRGVEEDGRMEYPFSRQLVQQVLSNGLPVLSIDVPEDGLLALNNSLRILGTRSILCVPLTSGENTLGVLYLDSSIKAAVFGHGELELARVIAEMAAGAIERSRYFGMLVQGEKMAALGTLLAGIAHELNGPLTTILGVADLIDDGELAQMLQEQGRRCRGLVRKLTYMAHPWDAQPRPVLLDRVIESTMPLLKAELTLRKVELKSEIAEDLPQLLGDEGSMVQVLLNLIQNSLLALDDQVDGKIWLDVEGNEQQVSIIISDNGPGIPAANLNRIFDPYFTTRERGKGTGLGLALTRTIVEQHGGRIEASNSPAGGAVFRISIPAATSLQEASNFEPQS